MIELIAEHQGTIKEQFQFYYLNTVFTCLKILYCNPCDSVEFSQFPLISKTLKVHVFSNSLKNRYFWNGCFLSKTNISLTDFQNFICRKNRLALRILWTR